MRHSSGRHASSVPHGVVFEIVEDRRGTVWLSHPDGLFGLRNVQVVQHITHAGHFGLPGMRERAEIVRGRLEIWTKRDEGTEVEMIIPGAIAYADPAGQSRLSKIITGHSRDFRSKIG